MSVAVMQVLTTLLLLTWVGVGNTEEKSSLTGENVCTQQVCSMFARGSFLLEMQTAINLT